MDLYNPMPVLYPHETHAARKSLAPHRGQVSVDFGFALLRARIGVGVRVGVGVGDGGGMGDGVDRDVGRDVDVVLSAGDEVLVAVGVGDGVGFCLVGTWIVESGCGFSDGDLGDGGGSILEDDILDGL